jgi:hypothetical protein
MSWRDLTLFVEPQCVQFSETTVSNIVHELELFVLVGFFGLDVLEFAARFESSYRVPGLELLLIGSVG